MNVTYGDFQLTSLAISFVPFGHNRYFELCLLCSLCLQTCKFNHLQQSICFEKVKHCSEDTNIANR